MLAIPPSLAGRLLTMRVGLQSVADCRGIAGIGADLHWREGTDALRAELPFSWGIRLWAPSFQTHQTRSELR